MNAVKLPIKIPINILPKSMTFAKFKINGKSVVKNEYGRRFLEDFIQGVTLYNWTPYLVTVRLLYPAVLQYYFIICHNVKCFLLFNIYKKFHEWRHFSGNFSRSPSWDSHSSLKFHHSFHKVHFYILMLHRGRHWKGK